MRHFIGARRSDLNIHRSQTQNPLRWLDRTRLFIGDLDVARIDLVNDVVWWLTVDRAPDGLCSPQNLLDGAREGLGE